MAAPVAARHKAGEARWRATTIAPLVAPAEPDGRLWRLYLRGAIERLAPTRQGIYGAGSVLGAPTSPDHAQERNAIRSALFERQGMNDFAFASPAAPEVLARVLIEDGRAARPGSLAGTRLFVALPPAAAGGVREALTATGATVIVFDPALPIPQRPEKLRELGVAPGGAEAAARDERAKALKLDAEAAALEAAAPPTPPAEPDGDIATEEMVLRRHTIGSRCSFLPLPQLDCSDRPGSHLLKAFLVASMSPR